MRKLLFISLFIIGNIVMANDLSTNQDYKNLQQYLTEAQAFVAEGDTKNAGKKLKYAEIFMKKLKKKGFETDLANEISQIDELTIQTSTKKQSKKHSPNAKTQQSVTSADADIEEYQYERAVLSKYKSSRINALLKYGNTGKHNYETYKDFNKDEMLAIATKLENVDDTSREIHNLKNDASKMQTAINSFDSNIKKYGTIIKIDRIIKNLNSATNTQTFNDDSENLEYFIKAILVLSPSNSDLQARLATLEKLEQSRDKIITGNNKPKDFRKYADSLPKAVQHDSKLEQQILDSVQSVYKAVVEFKSVILTEDVWVETKTPTEHFRSMDAVLTGKHIGKHADLGCFFQYYDLRQRPDGEGNWGKAGRNSSGERFYIDCEKI